MKVLNQLNVTKTIKPNNDNIKKLILDEVFKWGSIYVDLNHFDLDDVTDVNRLFYNMNFNGDISLWNVENIEIFHNMFEDSSFNGDLSGWKPTNAYVMEKMFKNSKFNGNIDGWKPYPLFFINDMFLGSPLEDNLPKWFKEFSIFRNYFSFKWEVFEESIRLFGWFYDNKVYRGRLMESIMTLDFDMNYSYIKNLNSKDEFYEELQSKWGFEIMK